MTKFKKGDFVRGKKGAPYSITNEDMTKGVVVGYEGEKILIKVLEHKSYEGDTKFDVNPRWFELIESKPSEQIVIYRKDNEVIALDKTTGKKGVAKCNPEDEFDFTTGAKLAFERLTGNSNEIKRKARVGEYVKVLSEDGHRAKKDEILKVINVWNDDGWVKVEGDKSVLRYEQYVVVENYKPKSITVGDKVKIIDSGKMYTTFIRWIKENVSDDALRIKFAYNESFYPNKVDKDFVVRVLVDNMAYIEDIETNKCYLFRVDGLKIVE